MTKFSITVEDQEVQAALMALSARGTNMKAVLQDIGESITERTKHRFETSTAPDGTPWAANSAATLGLLSARLAGKKSHVKKDGSLNALGQRALAGKKPLIDTGELRRQIVPNATDSTLTVTATRSFAAIHQFGGKAGRGHKVTIPARPFLPIMQNGDLYPDEKALVLQALNDFLMDGL